MTTTATLPPPEPTYITACRVACAREVVLMGLDERQRAHADEARRNDSDSSERE